MSSFYYLYMKSFRETSQNIIPLSEGMFDMVGADRLEKGVKKDATEMFLKTCKGNFNTVFFKDGSVRINGKLIISGVESDRLYLNCRDFHGALIIENCPKLATFEGSFLENIAVFDGSITINQCPSLTSLKGLPSLIKKDLSVTNCKKLKSIDGVDSVFGNVYWSGNGKKYTEEQLREKIHVIRKIFCGEDDLEANISESMVTEAFNNQWLQRLAAQFRKYPYKEYGWRDNEPDKYNNVNQVFQNYARVSSMYGRLLDKITSEDIDVYDMSDEKDKKDLSKAFYDAYSSKNVNGGDLFLVYKEDIGEFIGGFGRVSKTRGSQNIGMSWIYFPNKDRGAGRMGEGTWYTKTEAKEKLLDYGIGYTVVVINSGKTTGTAWDDVGELRRARQEAKTGVINPGDIEQYKKIAAANLKRYKDEVARIKATRKKDSESENYDKIIDEYEKINVRIFKLVRAVAKDPKAYRQYDITEFLNWIRDEKRSNPHYKYWQKSSGPQYYGANGPAYIFKSFMNAYLDCFGNSYKTTPDEYDFRSLENAAKSMKMIIDLADQKLKKFGF